MMKKDNLAEAKATLWQAYTLLHLTTLEAVEDDEVLDLLTALHGIKSLMFSGLEELEEVRDECVN